MTRDGLRVGTIDHVELFVPDRYEAADWYGQALGFSIVRSHEGWATEGGPLMISADHGDTMLALFEGDPRGQRETAGHHRVAFRVGGRDFLRILDALREGLVYDDSGTPSSGRTMDHTTAYSVYFCDPYGNRYEITTYDYDTVTHHIPR